jgi:hypothetical protein
VKFVKVKDPDGTMTGPTGINNSDTIVGTFIDSHGTETGFMATRGKAPSPEGVFASINRKVGTGRY